MIANSEMGIKEIADKLQIGDINYLSDLLCITPEYISMILKGKRRVRSLKSHQVLKAAQELIEFRNSQKLAYEVIN